MSTQGVFGIKMRAFTVPFLLRRQTLGFARPSNLACNGGGGGDVIDAWKSSSLISCTLTVQSLGCCSMFSTLWRSDLSLSSWDGSARVKATLKEDGRRWIHDGGDPIRLWDPGLVSLPLSRCLLLAVQVASVEDVVTFGLRKTDMAGFWGCATVKVAGRRRRRPAHQIW